MFDYARGYAPELEASGLMSIDRVPKFAYDFARSQRHFVESSPVWGGGPMVAIASYWNQESSPTVRVYTNADEVALYLNGKLLARKAGRPSKEHPNLRHPPLEFDVGRFSPGELKAFAFVSGAVVATDTVRTPGAPVSVRVRIDDMGVKPVPGDLIFVRATLQDKAGTRVPISGRQVQFVAEGGYAIVGSSLSSTEAGVASVLIRVIGPHGAIRADATGIRGQLP